MTRTAPDLVITTGTGMALHPQRIHRATCKRLVSPERLPDPRDVNVGTVAYAKPATCCKPGRAALDLIEQAQARMAAATPAVVPAMTASEPGTGELAGGDVQALPQSARPRVRKGNRHDQRGGFGQGGDYSGAAVLRQLQGSTIATAEGVVVAEQRHVQAPTAKRQRATEQARMALAQDVGRALGAPQGQTEVRCTGACGQLLPLTKFPTIGGGRRGTECRADRDARRAAAKAAK